MKKFGLIAGVACIVMSAYAVVENAPIKKNEDFYLAMKQDTIKIPDTIKKPKVPLPTQPDPLPIPIPDPENPNPKPDTVSLPTK
ncbi:hypothetical protein Pedsa_0644 [Pseudopedobacter saltans DSM 12145]|uniref:Uncharacterized protein n=1 Tax=Pseudopedobacter saltans (strain ATCC 51119 / DSM 12145 / JCM 21818 / CCUG 39354 / LMG 10337 / NBRC 100064 / NCIMB 13643) TaxID=762903 RepID=F0S7Z9_PSESL|nr:hypothetical protein [Pseudopedobacter saltans]ADY51220.1 hypothetical protein Pedsa_0644 [Pseudopedobacter saltans DSM 12145]